MESDRTGQAGCKGCGAPLPSHAREPICPRCALKGALELADESLPQPGLEAQAQEGSEPGREPIAVPAPVTVRMASGEGPGTLIGRYKLLEKVGEGGFGAVYVAEQREPVKRRVALKLIKLGMDTRQVVARFEAERQALALMDHPNIAKVFDAGATETGRPYFVMELVRGIPITRYCEQEKLETGKRLGLFISICHAIQHAHQKGIIHRDIKPSNILVTLHDGVPVAKVIDFGIAKATQQELTDKTVYTQFQQFIGTPAYMSPEQAEMSGLDIDTRTDIYSLGVLLYELLTGSTPFDTKELLRSGLEEMRKMIRERQPVRPSTRLRQTGLAKGASAPSAARSSQLSSDLDWIVMRCLEKDRTRRYETANLLALDLERHLKHEPVMARPPSMAYRVQKFVGRNRVMVTSATAVAVALVVSLGLSTWSLRQQYLLRQEAEVNAERADAERGRAEANAYAGDMNLAQHALEAGDVSTAWSLLEPHRPNFVSETRVSNLKSPESRAATTYEDGMRREARSNEDLRHWEWRFLWSLCQSDEVSRLPSEPEPTWIESVQVSPNGKVLAVRKGDGQVALWDLTARRQVMSLPASVASKDSMSSVSAGTLLRDFTFIPSSSLIAVATAPPGGNTEVVLWDATTGSERGRFPHRAAIGALASSTDGKRLAIFDEQQRITVVDLDTKEPRAHLAVSAPVWFYRGAVQFSPDGDRLAIGDHDGRVRIWEWQSGAEKILPQPPTRGVIALAWSPTEPLLASTGGFESTFITLWNPLTGETVGQLLGHTGWIGALAFSPDGQSLASASADRTVRLWRVANRTEERCFRGHRDEVWAVAFLAGEEELVSGDKEGTVLFWSRSLTNRAPNPVEIAEPATALAFVPDGGHLLLACWDGRIRLWNQKQLREEEQLSALGSDNYGLDVSPDGCWLAVGDRAGVVRVWDWPTRRALTNLSTVPSVTGTLLFSPGSRFLLARLASTNSARAQPIWDTSTWRELPPLAIDQVGSISLAVSPGEDVFAVGYVDGTVKLWTLPGGQLIAAFKEHSFEVHGLTFSPGGDLLVSAGGDGFATIWNVPTMRRLSKFRGHAHNLLWPTFSPDGRRLAIAAPTVYETKEAVKLWDVRTGRELITLRAEGHCVQAVFSPDGNTLAGRDDQGIVRLWSAPSFAEIEALEQGRKMAP
jgi:eukaryotic-like serine/threonine-protein kinase